ncbi:hypothetical protein BV22DRAFT_969994, partial [Leucogyrophana mollusca]
AFRSTRVAQQHDTLLRRGDWIWADSAYAATEWCVVPFKRPRGGRLTQEQKTFNVNLSRVRVRVEHAFAALKGCFQSLRELRLQMQSQKDLNIANYWIMCCFILHNMIIRYEEDGHGVIGGSQDWAAQEHGQQAGEPEEDGE